MTSDKEGSGKEQIKPGDVGGQKRPHATLDLKATEVKAASDVKMSGEKAAEQQLGAASAAAKASEPTKSASGATASASTKSAPKTGDQIKTSASATDATKTAQAASRPSRMGSHFAAGIVGGALVLLGVALGFRNYMPASTDASSSLNARLAALEQAAAKNVGSDIARRVAEAQSKLDELGKTVAALSETQAKLASEASALAAQVAETPGEADAVARVAKLEERLGTLAAAAENDPSAGKLEGLAAITGKITDVETNVAAEIANLRKSLKEDLDARLSEQGAAAAEARTSAERVERDMTGLKTDAARLGQRIETVKADAERIGTAVQVWQEDSARVSSALNGLKQIVETQLSGVARPADVASAVSPLSARLADLEQRLDGVIKTEDDRKANAERIVMSLELANLKRVIENGGKYSAELAGVRKAFKERIDLAVLDRYQDTGVPARADLEHDFRPVLRAVIDASADPVEGSLLDRIVANARSVVHVRKINQDPADTSVEAVLARMETALNENRLGDVLGEAKKIPARATEPAQSWLSQVEARHAVDRAIAALEDKLKSSLTDGAGAATPSTPGNMQN